MYDKKENAIKTKTTPKENNPWEVRIDCDDCKGTGFGRGGDCWACDGRGVLSIGGTRDNPCLD